MCRKVLQPTIKNPTVNVNITTVITSGEHGTPAKLSTPERLSRRPAGFAAETMHRNVPS